MKFEEVLPALREGKKIRKIGSRNYYYLENGRIRECSGVKSICALFGDNLLLTDWEIIEETKKVKLRDLTEEQYKKWFYNNCCSKNENKSISDCFVCVFHNAICNPESNRCWSEHKDLYSDKFLDQEIEVEEE